MQKLRSGADVSAMLLPKVVDMPYFQRLLRFLMAFVQAHEAPCALPLFLPARA